jgi:HPr kinase/phosphorylase
LPISVATFRKECSVALRLTLLAGEDGLGREIAGSRAQEAGLAVTGEVFPPSGGRVQVLGETEIAYFGRQTPDRQAESADRFFAGPLPCAVVSATQPVPELFLKAALRRSVPLFSSALATPELVEETHRQLSRILTETATTHGVLMEVLGVGVLLQGKSGVGKSECALDLILRGHRFVADDLVHIDKLGPATLVGRGDDVTGHHMEIRGLGIISIRDLFGMTATTHRKKVEVVVQLEWWDAAKEYDRLGIENRVTGFLGVDLPTFLIPVSPGRNLATVVEVAVRNHILKLQGVHSAKELVDRQDRRAVERKDP